MRVDDDDDDDGDDDDGGDVKGNISPAPPACARRPRPRRRFRRVPSR